VAGTYSLTAKAYDNSGAVTTSSAVTIAVNVGQTGTEDCSTIAPWKSTSIYVKDDLVTFNGFKYKAKWWTQNNSPATYSGQYDVWLKVGECITGTAAPAAPALSLIPSLGTTLSVSELLEMDVEGLSSGTAIQVSYVFYRGIETIESIVKNAPDFATSWSAKEIGDYQLQIIVKDANGMLIYSDAKAVKVSQTTSISSSASADLIQVVPNPNQAQFSIKTTSNIHLKGAKIEMTDMLGQKVYESLIQSDGEEIRAGELKAGMYLVKVTVGEKIMITKIQVY
jgi:hypothetical protein